MATNVCANCLPPASPVAGSVLPPEVYNWSAGTWRKLAAASALAPLTADETSNGTVRIRVSEVSPGYYLNQASVVQRTQ